MCGIAGFTGPPDAPTLERMTVALRHRGPDGDGFDSLAVGGRDVVHFGHRRLAVIDLARGRQPMRTADGALAITFNGEIYGFERLREQLASAGCVFRTRSDTEVLLQSLALRDEDALAGLDGMFAFAAFDTRRRRLLLAVDRFGQKPLVWFLTPERRLVFASEISALRQHPSFPQRIAPLSLARLLAFGHTPGEQTLFGDVFRLAPGSALAATVDSDGVLAQPRTFRYWKVEDALGAHKEALPDEEVVARLRDCVLSQLVADVPLGVFLSGGIDSTAVAALGSGRRQVLTLCMGSDQADYDETPLARRTAARIGSDHHELRLGEGGALATLEAVMRHLDEPLADAGCLPAWELYRQARGHVTVALGGDGGDELLEGYPTYGALALSRRLAGLGPLAPVLSGLARGIRVGEGYYPLGFQARRFAAGLAMAPAFRLQAYIGACPAGLLGTLLRPELLAQAGLDPGSPEFEERLYEPAARIPDGGSAPLEPADRAVEAHLRSFLAGSVLRKVDRMSMAHGLEVRAPMLGAAFADACLALPSRLRRRRGTGKRPLRSWLAAAGLGHVLGRPKRGFSIPVARWLRGPLRPLGDELFLQASSPLREWCRLERAGELWRRHLDGREDARKELWALLTLGVWAWHHLREAPLAAGVGHHAQHR